MVTGAEGITDLVLVSSISGFILQRALVSMPTAINGTQNYRLSLPARQTEPPRWLIAIPGKVVKTLAISFA